MSESTENGTNGTLRIGQNIADRLVQFGVACIRIAGLLPTDTAGKHIAGQLLRSGTAGGAHYGEARAAESRADFAHKAGVTAKELHEAVYWLRLIEQCGWAPRDVTKALDEAQQLAAILGASAQTARRRLEENR